MQNWVSFQPSDVWSLTHRLHDSPFMGGNWLLATQSCWGCYKKVRCFPTTKDKSCRFTFLSFFTLSEKILSLSQMSHLSTFPFKLLGLACLEDLDVSGGLVLERDFQSFTVVFSLDSTFTATHFIVFNTISTQDTSCKNIWKANQTFASL